MGDIVPQTSLPKPTFPASSVGTRLVFTTNTGLEDVVIDEFGEKLQAAGLTLLQAEPAPFGLGGYVFAECAEELAAISKIALKLRSVHHVLNPHYSFSLPTRGALEAIGQEVTCHPLPAMETIASFRVTSRRNGTHDFTSMDVQRVAGAALVAHYGRTVDLTGFDLEVRVDVFADTCLVGTQLTRHPLSKRYWRIFQPRAALRANVAYAALRCAHLETPDCILLDPFCGSGTILIEAAQVYPDLKLHGSDMHGDTVTGARRNAAALGLSHRIGFERQDARRLRHAHPPQYFNAVVTNPPFGVRTGQRLDFFQLYRRFLEQVWHVMRPGGLLVLVIAKRGIFNKVLERCQALFTQQQVRIVETGGIYPTIFVLERN